MKRGTKKVKTWIKYFPEDIQEKIMNNIETYSKDSKNKVLNSVEKSQSDTLLVLFTWFDTDESKGEGFNYWNNIHEDLLTKGK